MKRILSFVFWVSVTILSVGCTTKRILFTETNLYVDPFLQECAVRHAYIEAFEFVKLDAGVERVFICFKQGEAPYYKVYTLTGRLVYVDFFDDECFENGCANGHRKLVRTFHIAISDGEIVEKIDDQKIIVRQQDGTKHCIYMVLVNWPGCFEY